MAGCINISSIKEGAIRLSSEREGQMLCFTAREGRISLKTAKNGQIEAGSERYGKMMVSSSFVCEVSKLAPYLEIEPAIVWLVDYEAQNRVLSNTRWNIE